ADVGQHAGDDQAADVPGAQGEVERGAVELVVGVAGDHELVRPRQKLRDYLGRVGPGLGGRPDQAVAGGQPKAGRLTRAGWQVLRPERVAGRARDGRRVNELGEDHRYLLLPAGLDQALQVGDDVAAGGHLQGGARLQEAALHVDDQKRRPPRLQAVQLV